MKRPNVLWIMTDQHNANCTGYRQHPNVKTPNLDSIAKRGVDFPNAFVNNPICSPSRICFMTGQYAHTHKMLGNNHAEYPEANPDTLACQFRRYGYQTGLFGEAHMIRKWDSDGFESIRYCDLCDAEYGNPDTTHYFKYLEDKGLADMYEYGTPKNNQVIHDGSQPAFLPHEDSVERFTGNETINFLNTRDESRPFFIHMSFERPHPPVTPALEHFDMYNTEEIVLPENAFDYFENKFKGKPKFMTDAIEKGMMDPFTPKDSKSLKRYLASYYALITVIDSEIGRVLKKLEQMGELENTIILFAADHGDFAGEHGLGLKNFGIYDSVQRIPFLLCWPGGPKGEICDSFAESVDVYPTLCGLCNIPVPNGREGRNLVPIIEGKEQGKDEAYCEWCTVNYKLSAIRTRDFRLVFYGGLDEGELYDHRTDPGETNNLWFDKEYTEVRLNLTERLLKFTLEYKTITNASTDRELNLKNRYAPSRLILKYGRYWSKLKKAYEEDLTWPPTS